MTPVTPTSMTIGHLARAASVGVETIRYYQRRGLLPVPPTAGAFRRYPAPLVARIHFIKRAQELGFSLDEIAELLRLEQGAERTSIRRIASDRLAEIERKVADLNRMRRVLRQLVSQCEHTRADLPCPIIATLGLAHGIPGYSTTRKETRRVGVAGRIVTARNRSPGT